MTTSTSFKVGDKVKVKPGKDHEGMGKGEAGEVVEISTPALAVKFPSMHKPHKWYVDDEIERA